MIRCVVATGIVRPTINDYDYRTFKTIIINELTLRLI